ncbi:MAG: PIN domain-containing protein [Nanoarchaeota archaeon]|nr:PIN domain-containing protein [Nanoarchaeota archaeon]
MKELIANLLAMDLSHARNLVFLDTSFFISCMEHHERMEMLLKIPFIAMTSFNAEELLHIERNLSHSTRKNMRDFLKEGKIVIVNIGTHPGDWKAEREFVELADPALLAHVHDPSDAVLIAAAIRTHSNVFTKDKRHLFTVELEEFVKQYDIKVYKELFDISV